jgi:hypothetical protein
MLTLAQRLHLRPIDGLLLLLSIGSVVGYTIIAAYFDAVGFPLDDSWIHQTYARNLADFGEWSFIPGTPSAGSTAPLYSTLLAIGHLINISPFAWAHFLGILALFIAGAISVRLAEKLFPTVPYVGLGTGILIVLSWHLGWAAASGMETMLFMSLSLVVIALAWREIEPTTFDTRAIFWRGSQLGVGGGFLFLTRPEGIGLLGLAGLVALISWHKDQYQAYAFWALGVGIGFLIVVSPYLILNYSLTDGLLPTTADAKIAENAPLRELSVLKRYANMVIPLLAGAQFMWLPAIIWGLIVVTRRITRQQWLYLLPPIWAFAHVTLFVIQLPAPYQHGRYTMAMLLPFLIFAVGGMGLIVMAGKDTPVKRVLSRTLALSAIIAIPAFWWIGGKAYGADVRIINTEMVKASKWIASHPDIIPEDDLLAVHDIGAVGYYAPREIFDLAGLVSPEVIPIILDDEALMQMMCERGVEWMMVLPDQQPAKDDDPRLELVYTTDEPYITDAGGKGNMKVFRLHFDDECTAP